MNKAKKSRALMKSLLLIIKPITVHKMVSMSVTIEDKYNPDYGFRDLESEQFPNLNEKLNQFTNGEITPSFIAREFIELLFNRDFSNDNSKWDVDSSSCIQIGTKSNSTEDFPISFDCEQKATWDHKDIYAVAKSSAKITFLSRNEIKIEKYSYYVSG
jgi:hypothetical protein